MSDAATEPGPELAEAPDAATRPRHSYEPVPEDALSLADMLATGVSYRRLDHWVRRGWLSPTDAKPGSGFARTWTPRDRTIVQTMLRLTSAGISADVAAPWAIAAADHGVTSVTVNDVTISWKGEA